MSEAGRSGSARFRPKADVRDYVGAGRVGTHRSRQTSLDMTAPAEEPNLIVDPLKPEAVDGYVEAVDPPNEKLKMTADAAEVSAIRLLDAAAKARED